MDKAELRKSMLYKRNLIEAEEKNFFDEKIINAFLNLDSYKNAKSICIYVNYGSEINTKKIIEKTLKEGKEIFVPRMIKHREMEFIKISSVSELKKNKIGVLEPKKELIQKVEKIELLVLPGLAFDLDGGRVGYGGGYYDRYLNNRNILKIALAYEFQVLNEVPMEEHDIKYDYLITEKRMIRI